MAQSEPLTLFIVTGISLPVPGGKMSNNNRLTGKSGGLVPPQIVTQQSLFHVEKQVEFDGIEMGVLENGIPYLSERGLARMCGVDRKAINRLATNWQEEKSKERGIAINQLLEKSGYFEEELFLKSELSGVVTNAYTEPVCLAILEYYAFLSRDNKREEAVNAFRTLARTSFRAFIYQATGYSPDQRVLDSWQHFHDRIDMVMDAVPPGYFSVFREIAAMIVPMIRSGIMISDKVVPDISVGRAWSAYWEQNKLGNVHGERVKYNHEYPLYYPQSKSNPQPAFAYPDSALGTFRAWLRETYIAKKFPDYMIRQAQQGKVTAPVANKAIETFFRAPQITRK
jgi:hypothetical protein